MDTTEIKVTRIGNRWHARLFLNGELHNETACALRQDIGPICREMLRWVDKMGWSSLHADRARHRRWEKNNCSGTVGKVWYNMHRRKLNNR